MIKTSMGSDRGADGVSTGVSTYYEGKAYALSPFLANLFLKDGRAEITTPPALTSAPPDKTSTAPVLESKERQPVSETKPAVPRRDKKGKGK